MFDYQAGERYKLTLIMVGAVGVIAGIFLMIIVAPPSEAPRKKRPMSRSSYDPDVTGIPRSLGGGSTTGTTEYGAAATQGATAVNSADGNAAKDFVRAFASNSFDFSASTAASNQQKAMAMMSPETASNYQANVWGPVASQVTGSDVTTQFTPSVISTGQANPDGSIVVFLQGQLALRAADGHEEQKAINMEYLVQKMPDGSMRIAGIQEK
ncbi:MAG: hypothetical protein IPL73_08935 [Candidatus Obscuribacter sp.]|nr:hypothetical protein [Candidatus Obscuribacter sp.]